MSPKVKFEPLSMTSDKSYVSAISKLAPSPDWFSGFHDFNAINEGRNTWYQEFTIPVYPFDAGIKDGETYEVMNAETTVPQQLISQFNPNNLPDSKVFLNADGDSILPVAAYSCFLSDENGEMLPTRFDRTQFAGSSTSTSQMSEKGGNAGLIIGLSVGLGIAALFGGFLTYYLIRRRKSSKDITINTTDVASNTTYPDLELDDDGEEKKDIEGHEIA